MLKCTHFVLIINILIFEAKKTNNYLSFRYWLFKRPTAFSRLYWAI